MFGKHFASMYEGSLYGSGAVVFAVMGYVIATQRPDWEHGSVVTLNPRKLADTLGEDLGAIEKAIGFLCGPDPHSTTKKEDGRRLVRVGEFEFRVVNGAKYRAIRDEETRRAQNREAQRRLRDGKTRVKPAGPTKSEAASEPLGRPGEKVVGELSDIAVASESALGKTIDGMFDDAAVKEIVAAAEAAMASSEPVPQMEQQVS